jgi:6-phosphogluconolactonase
MRQWFTITGAVLLGVAFFGANSAAQSPAAKPEYLYASVGPDLTRYALDADAATLTRNETVTLPENVQYAWPHRSGRFLYVAWSNGATKTHHGVTAFTIEPLTGVLHPHGEPVPIPFRPIHVTVDNTSMHLLLAHNSPSGLTVVRIEPNGMLGAIEPQPAGLDFGVFAHQVRVPRASSKVYLVTRGNGPEGEKPEDPGAIKVFEFKQGLLANSASTAPNGGIGFQPRHLDFHPTRPWVFVSVERQNTLQVYRRQQDGVLGVAPLFTVSSLADPGNVRPQQVAGAIHVHPNGRFLYQANRANGTTTANGVTVFAGGENSIAVYALNISSGEPTLVQHADTRGLVPRSFSLGARGRVLVAANQSAMTVKDGDQTSVVPASLVVFKVLQDGRLEFANKYDVDTTETRQLFWVGILPAPTPAAASLRRVPALAK